MCLRFLLFLCLSFSFFQESLASPSSSSVEEQQVQATQSMEKQDKPTLESIPEYDYWTEFMKMLTVLALLILLLIFSSWFLKKLMQSRMEQMNKCSRIKIKERRALSQKSMALLVQVDEHEFLLAESSAGIHFLSPIQQKLEEKSFKDMMRSEMS